VTQLQDSEHDCAAASLIWNSLVTSLSRLRMHDSKCMADSVCFMQDVRKQLLQIMDRYKLDMVSAGRSYVKIQKAICSGFFFHAARKDPQEVSTAEICLTWLLSAIRRE